MVDTGIYGGYWQMANSTTNIKRYFRFSKILFFFLDKELCQEYRLDLPAKKLPLPPPIDKGGAR